MYDRDWYREERRQARQGKYPASPVSRSAPAPVCSKPSAIKPAGPPSLTSVKSVLIILAVFAVALIAYGFA